MSKKLEQMVEKENETSGILMGADDDDAVTKEEKGERKPNDLKTGKESRSPTQKTSEEYAYEALASDMDEWVVYDPSCDDLDEWLDTNLPSVLSREDHIGWISVIGNQNERSQDLSDFQRLQNGWKKLKESGEAVDYYSIRKLAKESNVVHGKWLFHVKSGCKVDIIWRKIAKQLIGGVLANVATSAKVSPREPEVENYQHVVCVYNSDYTNESQVLKLNSVLREAGVKSRLLYKPDVYTHLSIYRNNEWKIRPSIYESTYDLLKRESTVTTLYDKA